MNRMPCLGWWRMVNNGRIYSKLSCQTGCKKIVLSDRILAKLSCQADVLLDRLDCMLIYVRHAICRGHNTSYDSKTETEKAERLLCLLAPISDTFSVKRRLTNFPSESSNKTREGKVVIFNKKPHLGPCQVLNNDSKLNNPSKRVAEVWLDDFKKYFYQESDVEFTNRIDVSDRIALKGLLDLLDNNGCQFLAFLSNCSL